MGYAISKAVTVAEILKHRVAHLHQITQLALVETVDVYEPLEEGLDQISMTRHIPSITIELSLDQLDTTNPGYQPPIPVELVSPQFEGRQAHSEDEDKPASKSKPKKEQTKKPREKKTDGATTEEDNAGQDNVQGEVLDGKRESKRGRARRGRKSPATQADAAVAQATNNAEAPAAVDSAPAVKARRARKNKSNAAEVGESATNAAPPVANGESHDENEESGGRGRGKSGRGRGRGRGSFRGRGRGRGDKATASDAPNEVSASAE
jgi:ribonucleases P/MRP protein subunit RPP25